jgi:hypothetical protein
MTIADRELKTTDPELLKLLEMRNVLDLLNEVVLDIQGGKFGLDVSLL